MKRKLLVGGKEYQVRQDMTVADKHYILAESKNKKDTYIVIDLLSRDNCEIYNNIAVTNDYLQALDEWNSRIQTAIKSCKEMRERNADSDIIKADEVEKLSTDTDINNKIIVIRESALKPEYRYPNKQIYLCAGGYGADNSSFGNSVICINLFSGEISRFSRSDILGILKQENTPEWVKLKIKKIQTQFNSSITV